MGDVRVITFEQIVKGVGFAVLAVCSLISGYFASKVEK
jgi:hypothetical protein